MHLPTLTSATTTSETKGAASCVGIVETVCGIVLIRTVSSQRLLDRTSRRWATSWSSQASEVRWLHSLRPTFLPWIRWDSIHGDYTNMHSFVWLFRVVTGVGLIDYILRSVSFKFIRHDGFCWISSHYILRDGRDDYPGQSRALGMTWRSRWLH